MGVLSSVGHQAIVSGLAMAVLASINVGLRFFAKNSTKSGVKAEDYWILIGLVGFWAYVGVLLWGAYAKLFTKNQLMMQACSMVQMELDQSISSPWNMMSWKPFS